ncbi:MAG: cytochrome C oxidase subunit III [Flavobacterium sp.]|nr:MAG: cytochrome C oxidase subunit III [Flavobacterium sp.]
MKLLIPFLRVLFFAIIAFFLFEVIAGTDDQFSFEKYPMVQTIFWGLVILAIFIEVVVGALKTRVFNSLNEKAQERFEAYEDDSYFGKLYTKMLDSKPIEQEEEIVLDHNYDGIKELDNTLPPWWVYLFYASIFFAVFYLAKYEIFDGDSTTVEYEKEVAQAEIDIAEWKKTAKDLIDASSVELLTEASDLEAGKQIFTTNCVVCHKADGGGSIGPNLTDENWILGGGIKNVFTTIIEGGRPGKGMVPWKNDLKPSEIAQVASYVLGFQGTTPAAPKVAEGDVWVEE